MTWGERDVVLSDVNFQVWRGVMRGPVVSAGLCLAPGNLPAFSRVSFEECTGRNVVTCSSQILVFYEKVMALTFFGANIFYKARKKLLMTGRNNYEEFPITHNTQCFYKRIYIVCSMWSMQQLFYCKMQLIKKQNEKVRQKALVAL